MCIPSVLLIDADLVHTMTLKVLSNIGLGFFIS